MKHRTKIRSHLQVGVAATLVTFSAATVLAESTREYSASAVRVLNSSATMHEQDVGWITTTSGPIGSEGIPDVIRRGDTIAVEGKTVTANIIEVTEILEDMTYRGEIFAHAGEVRCVIASSAANIPNDDERDRLWIHITDCEPLQR